MSVFVCGSLHYDVVVNAPHLPRLDETVPGTGVRYIAGGKGGNQAVAAARMGAPTAFAGRIGDDAFGASLLTTLANAGVDTSQMQRGAGASGMSVAIVDPAGGYGAVIVSAANLAIDPSLISVPEHTKVVLLQNEVPEAVNLTVALKGRAAGASVILNAGPARPMGADLLDAIDILVVNRVEAADLLSVPEATLDPLEAAKALSRLGPHAVIVTLGGDGLVFYESGVATHHPGHAVGVVSTHGAGDAFLGALAAASASGHPLEAAARFGQAAAALHVSTPVDQRHMITPAAVRMLMAQTSSR
ncbi:PfkB family carbohydrate kinase [Hoeflea olei]|uniref:Ribokinase n=1 Tax=Hoeflea olei TaxID=1480615 RepID=A0A1C1Z180_9HYPH|nr:PfkB family carbohydrate kinase [Hoeflea olei]OCW59522.1 ribokinase [Hoeflea olei]